MKKPWLLRQNVKDTVNGITGSEELVLVKAKKIVEACLKNGLAYRMEVKPAEVLARPMTRAGQTLSAVDAWQNLECWSQEGIGVCVCVCVSKSVPTRNWWMAVVACLLP